MLDLPTAAACRWPGPAPEDRGAGGALLPAGPLIGMGPTANWSGKIWPADRFAALFRALAPSSCRARGRWCSPGRARPSGRMADPVLAALPDAIDLAGKLTLPEAAACIARCTLFIGNDSGLMHLAAAAGAPTLGLFGPTLAREYAPARPAGRRGGGAAGPSARRRSPALSVEPRWPRPRAAATAPRASRVRMAHVMAGAPAGGAELFFERLTAALHAGRARPCCR